MTIVLPWNSAVLHWQLQPCWSALSKSIIWSFIFRITAVFSCLFYCGEFGRDTWKAFCQVRAGSLLCEALRRMCREPSHAHLEADIQAAPWCDPDPTQAALPLKYWMTLLALFLLQGIVPIAPMGFLHCSAELTPGNPYGRTLLGVKIWGAPPLFIVCITQAPKIYKVCSSEKIAGF